MPKKETKNSDHYYRNKDDNKEDAKLYNMLQETVARFVTLDHLVEVAHGMDTHVNGSFNNTVSWFVPKNKVYCRAWSLTNRVGLALGINSVSLEMYFKRLFKLLGIAMTPNVLHFLKVKERNRVKQLDKIKTREMKKLRMKSKFDNLKKDEVIAKRERSKRDGSYRSGQNMGEDMEANLHDQQRQKKIRRTVVCPHCG